MNRTAHTLKNRSPIEILAELGVRTSHQRVVILRYLLDHNTHPSADSIYRDLSPTTAGLSRTTVYNTMRLFVKKGLVDELSIDGSESRYDLRDTSHSHFKCRNCGKIYDLPISSIKMLQKMVPAGFQIEEQHLYLKGICADCASSPQYRKASSTAGQN